MKTLLRALLILLNLLIPYLTTIALVFGCFFIYGSGAMGAEKLEKEMYIWKGIFILIGIVHLFLAYKYIKFLSKVPKIILIALLGLLYIYIAAVYM